MIVSLSRTHPTVPNSLFKNRCLCKVGVPGLELYPNAAELNDNCSNCCITANSCGSMLLLFVVVVAAAVVVVNKIVVEFVLVVEHTSVSYTFVV